MTTSNEHRIKGGAGKTILVTGASSSIGKATARRLLEDLLRGEPFLLRGKQLDDLQTAPQVFNCRQ